MTELTLKVNHAAKTVQATGRVAVGEDVALNLVMGEEVEDLAQLRVRLRFMGRDVAVFPFPGSTDEWQTGEAGEDEYSYTGVLNLNTVQLNALFAELGDGAVLTCAVVVDQVSNDDGTDDYNVLYGKGALRVWNWNGDLSVTPDVDEAPAPVSLRECLDGKVDKVVTSGAGNVVVFETLAEEGSKPHGVADSGVAISDGNLSSSSSTVPTSRAVKAEIDAICADMAQDVSDLEGMIAEKADSSDLADKADKADLNDKVDKVAGKGLSSNDFTDALKDKLDDMADYSAEDAEKLDGIEDGATKVIVDADITKDSANAVASGAVFDMKEHLHQKINAVYTKTEVDAIVAAVKTGSRQVVESLDSVTDPQPLVIYMVAKASAQTSNVYDEYIWLVSEGVGSWEKIGDTEVDLSGYVQKETGKGLSSNDYTTEEKQKLAGVEAGAQKNVTPTAPSTDASAAGKPADAKATGDALAGKQATISDLETIRSGAEAGATAVQSVNGVTPTAGALSITGEEIPIAIGGQHSVADAVASVAARAEEIGDIAGTVAERVEEVAAALRYAAGETITESAQLADRTGNRVVPLASNATDIVLTFPDAATGYLRDFEILVTNTVGNAGNITFTPPTGATVYGDGFTHSPASGETWLYVVSEVAANVFWCKSEKMEVAQ